MATEIKINKKVLKEILNRIKLSKEPFQFLAAIISLM